MLVATLVPIGAGGIKVADIGSGPGYLHIGIIAYVVLIALGWEGLTVVNPNEARALVLFGRYAGSLKSQGFWWVNPFTRRPRISIKVRNFESQKLKVNDHDGNPIEIAAVGGARPSPEGRHRGDGHPHQSPGLRPRDRQCDATAPAGERGHRRSDAD